MGVLLSRVALGPLGTCSPASSACPGPFLSVAPGLGRQQESLMQWEEPER